MIKPMRLFGLIGYPLTHSFSKKYFTEKFEKENLHDCRYENFEIETIDLLPQITLYKEELEGLNVTIPYKERVIKFLDDSNELVKETGACNCIRIENGKQIGYNTDVIAFERSLLPKLQPIHRAALILGTGGAAKAVQFVFKKMGISYQLVSRNPSADQLSYSQVNSSIIQTHHLIINTTPVGLYPNVSDAPPLPYDAVTPNHFLFDLIYNPERTLFLAEGEKRGAAVQNGYDMLVYQAEESWKIWNQ
jgi:shikimate dehydrogenase